MITIHSTTVINGPVDTTWALCPWVPGFKARWLPTPSTKWYWCFPEVPLTTFSFKAISLEKEGHKELCVWEHTQLKWNIKKILLTLANIIQVLTFGSFIINVCIKGMYNNISWVALFIWFQSCINNIGCCIGVVPCPLPIPRSHVELLSIDGVVTMATWRHWNRLPSGYKYLQLICHDCILCAALYYSNLNPITYF